MQFAKQPKRRSSLWFHGASRRQLTRVEAPQVLQHVGDGGALQVAHKGEVPAQQGAQQVVHMLDVF